MVHADISTAPLNVQATTIVPSIAPATLAALRCLTLCTRAAGQVPEVGYLQFFALDGVPWTLIFQASCPPPEVAQSCWVVGHRKREAQQRCKSA